MTRSVTRWWPLLGLAIVLGTALWLRVGYEPNAGSHRITVEHVEAQAFDLGVEDPDFVPVEVTVQRPRGTWAWSADIYAQTWRDLGDGRFRSKPGSAQFIYAGQVSPITWVSWKTGESGATLRVTVDGELVEQVEAAESAEGIVPIEFEQSLPRSSLLLLLVAIGWCVPLSGFVLRRLQRLTAGLDRRQVSIGAVGLLGGCLLVTLVWPVDDPAVVRYDLTVQPIVEPSSSAAGSAVRVRIFDVDDQTRLASPPDLDVGWAADEDGVFSTVASPWRFVFVGSPQDRIEIPVTDEPIELDLLVNDRRTLVESSVVGQPPLTRTLAELAPPLDGLDRLALWGARLGDLALIAAVLVAIASLVNLAMQGGDRRRDRLPLPRAQLSDDRPRLVRALSKARFALGVWATFLVILWPGMMNPDSAMQWKSLERGQWSDWHPYPMGAVLGVMRWFIDSPWLPIGLIALTVGILVGLAATWAEDAGLPTWCVRAVAWGPALAPVTAIMTVALWKDVVMGVGVLALVLVLWKTERSGGEWLRARRWNVAIAVVACLAIWLTRHNGWPIVVGSVVLMAMFRPAARRSLLTVVLIAIAIALFVRVPLKQALGVERGPVVAHNYMQRISVHVNAGTHLEPDEREYLAGFRPLDIEWPYDCSTVQTTWFGTDVIPWRDYVDDEAKLRNLALKLAFRNPRVEAAHLKCSSKIVWQITDRGSYTYFLDGYTNAGFVNTIPVDRGDMPLEAHPSNSLAVTVFDGFVGLPSALIRPALYLYVLLGAVAFAARRRRSLGPVLVAMPAFLQTVTLLPFGLVQDTRFQYGTVLVAIVMTPILLAESIRRDPEPTDLDEPVDLDDPVEIEPAGAGGV